MIVLRPAVQQCRRNMAATREHSLELDPTPPGIVYTNNRLKLARVSASLVL
jgi:hypothetical protein